MNVHDATEQAYKNGYEAGFKDAKADDFIAGVMAMTMDLIKEVKENAKKAV